ncbi:MAG TPA: SpoIID/LytB domain-containing protein, partial [Candidatus Limnocylindrales bacterium]
MPGREGQLLQRRSLLVVTLAISLAASALAAAPAALPGSMALAAGSCTGWQSITEPPETIRVGRPDGTVEVVDFRRYVEIVMAREWEAYHPAATLEAAAVAVKQYGWFYARAGKWRSSYINEAGECYDVKSTTADQLYQPEKVAVVKPEFIAAIDATWGLTVRKSGKFFLTGYRSGKLVPCGEDATGWKLFAKSVIDCGRQGWTREQIQLTYYAPDVTFHWAEGTGPPPEPVEAPLETPITAPDVELVSDVPLSGAWARVEW